MEAALESLPEAMRAVLWLRIFEDRNLTETAGRLGLTLETTRYRFRKASLRYYRALGPRLGSSLPRAPDEHR